MLPELPIGPPVEPPMELLTLPPAERVTKPAPQFSMEPNILTEPVPPLPPPPSKLFIPNVASFAKEHCFGVDIVFFQADWLSRFAFGFHPLQKPPFYPSALGPSLSFPVPANGSLRFGLWLISFSELAHIQFFFVSGL